MELLVILALSGFAGFAGFKWYKCNSKRKNTQKLLDDSTAKIVDLTAENGLLKGKVADSERTEKLLEESLRRIAFLTRERDLLKNKVSDLEQYEAIKAVDEAIEVRKRDASRKIAEQVEWAREQIQIERRRLQSEKGLASKELAEKVKQIEIQIQQEREKLSDQIRQARKNQARSKVAMNNATQQAFKIIADARERAKQIAGDALDAKNNAKHFEETARAMKNLIEGYGDDYLIPNHTLIDDLAEEYDHSEAGRKLKQARERTRLMLKQNTAAACDYAEEKRKKTAIAFVLDAYNAKTDAILFEAKGGNYGLLLEKIDNAYSIVNEHGSAFRYARINQEYHNSRKDELFWTVSTQEFKVKEREEQRQIKQAMREEERARREYEKAQKEAMKEEEMLQRALEIARKEMAGATAEQRVEYERRLGDLKQQLQEAEERNQRALSMAQQTKRGHVYIISNMGSFGEHVYKIGMTRRLEPLDRVNELGDASVPFSFDVHAMLFSDDAPALERKLHKCFDLAQVNKVNPRKEFFRVQLSDIKHKIKEMGIEVHWTMRAQAEEYRETLAIEKNLAENGAKFPKYYVPQDTTIEPATLPVH